MKILPIVLLLAGFLPADQTAAQSAIRERDRSLSVGVSSGYYSGLGLHLDLTVNNLTRDLPLSLRLGLGWSSVEPGKPQEARRIFINDATNGIPEESGRLWDFRLDLLLPLRAGTGNKISLFAGPRYGRFTANFKFVGGNEDFDVTSRQWALGGGLEASFPISSRLALVLTGGLDYYFESRLEGHDTAFSPDGDNVNPRKDYDYDDADEVIEQPSLEARAMLGFRFGFN